MNQETAARESLVERTFAAQDFLILALQNLNKEIDEDRPRPERRKNDKNEPKPVSVRSGIASLGGRVLQDSDSWEGTAVPGSWPTSMKVRSGCAP